MTSLKVRFVSKVTILYMYKVSVIYQVPSIFFISYIMRLSFGILKINGGSVGILSFVFKKF